MTVALRQAYSTYSGYTQAGVAVIAGDLIIVAYGYIGALAAVSCSDTAAGGTNTYNQIGSGQAYAGTAQHVFYAVAKATETISISCTSESDPGLSVHVVSGMNQTLADVLDVSAKGYTDSAAGTATSPSITTTNADDYLFALWSQESKAATVADNGTGFTKETEQSGHAHATFDKIVSAAGTYQSSISWSGVSLSYCATIAAFKAAGGSGGTTYNQSVAGAFPAPSGATSHSGAYGEAVAGDFPAPSGSIAKRTGKMLAGAVPAASGSALKLTSRALAGNVPAPSGNVGHGAVFHLFVSGIMGTVTGVVVAALNPVVAAVKRLLKVIGSGFKKIIGG